MQVKDFIKWLKTQPQDAIVQVKVEHEGYGGSYTSYEEFNPNDHAYLMDFTKNKQVQPDSPVYQKKILELGAE